MIRALFAPQTPAEEERRERERVAKHRPHLALVGAPDKRPDPDMFAWKDPAELWERRS